MKEILRSTNPVELSWVIATLEGAGIQALEFDIHASIIEGSIGAIPRRIMVADDDYGKAQKILKDAGKEVGI